jgi:hypothetical protein
MIKGFDLKKVVAACGAKPDCVLPVGLPWLGGVALWAERAEIGRFGALGCGGGTGEAAEGSLGWLNA